MTIRSLPWLWLTVCLYGVTALGYSVANFPHFPLREKTGELVWWIDVFVFYTGSSAGTVGAILASARLIKSVGKSRTMQMITGTVVMGFVIGWLISLILHTLNPSLYQGWS